MKLLSYFIQNLTPYHGRIHLTIRRAPTYGNRIDVFNQVHLRLPFRYALCSRVRNGGKPCVYDLPRLEAAGRAVNLVLTTSSPIEKRKDDAAFWANYLTVTGKHVDVEIGLWAARKGYQFEDLHNVCKIMEQTVALPSGKTCVGYIGFARGAMRFRIGDTLFDEAWDDPTRDMDKVPFLERGFKKIETLEEARQAALNFARYTS